MLFAVELNGLSSAGQYTKSRQAKHSSDEITIPASGSKGNAAVIRAGEQRFLVDVGISRRQPTERSGSGRH